LITYRVRLDVPRELILFVSRLLARHRMEIGTRKGTRCLGCYRQALFVLAWYRDKTDIPRLGAGFGLSQATSYRYVAEGTTVIAAEAPGLEEALERAVAAGPSPLSLDELWRSYLARFDIEHAFKLLKGTLGLTAAKVRDPGQADRWARILMAAHAQLLLARPLAADLRRPWEKQPDPARPLAPGRVRRGFRNIRHGPGTPARLAKPSRPGPGRPKGSSKGPAPRHLLPGEAGTPRTANTTLTREKVKT